MKTKNILETGIDRNFLRQCIKKKIIEPKRSTGIDIINEDYMPHSYTQKELETVWMAYLCRKMGFSFDDIKLLTTGHQIDLYKPMDSLIIKYIHQMKELSIIIDFMKYVKAVGFLPPLPFEELNSKTFIEFLEDFMEKTDPNKTIMNWISLVDEMYTIDMDSPDADQQIEELNKKTYEMHPISPELKIIKEHAYMQLTDINKYEPYSIEAQKIIEDIYNAEKLSGNFSSSLVDFAQVNKIMLTHPSDMSMLYQKMFGEEIINHWLKALDACIDINE